MYVDDELEIADTTNQAICIAATISKSFKDMGMKGTKCGSNGSKLFARIPQYVLLKLLRKYFRLC